MKAGTIRATLRVFAVQGSWNFERMLGIGLGYSEEPLLRDLPGGVGGERYRAALARASGYFNAHPYLVGLAAGALARTEHDALPPDDVERLRRALPGPLGSVGDRLVWAGALPTASGVGIALAATAPVGVGAAALLMLHNLVHVALRLWGVRAGWRLGTGVARALDGPVLRAALRVAGPLAGVATGFALPLAAAWLTADLDGRVVVGVAATFAVTLLVTRWIAPSLGGTRLGLLAAGVALAGGLL